MRFIAFYLPQYHPVPENDLWWGKGFTDWANVRKAKPRFKGHYQPHIPSSFGYYDLRDPAIRLAQASMAQDHGIDAFCYYHYWFNGKRLLNEPLDGVLSRGEPAMPFCLCWANENWTRAWDGQNRQILIRQRYSPEDHHQHASWLVRVFTDSRYLKVGSRPLLLIYRTADIGFLDCFVSELNRLSALAGLDSIYLCSVRSDFPQRMDTDLRSKGLQAVVDFQPSKYDFGNVSSLERGLFFFKRRLNSVLKDTVLCNRTPLFDIRRVVRYEQHVSKAIHGLSAAKAATFLPCVFPSWDNSARRAEAIVIQNDNPALYGKWLSTAISFVKRYPQDEQLVFINAWNEWAEGCHLEPDEHWGSHFLQETKKAKDAFLRSRKISTPFST